MKSTHEMLEKEFESLRKTQQVLAWILVCREKGRNPGSAILNDSTFIGSDIRRLLRVMRTVVITRVACMASVSKMLGQIVGLRVFTVLVRAG